CAVESRSAFVCRRTKRRPASAADCVLDAFGGEARLGSAVEFLVAGLHVTGRLGVGFALLHERVLGRARQLLRRGFLGAGGGRSRGRGSGRRCSRGWGRSLGICDADNRRKSESKCDTFHGVPPWET